MNIHTLLHIIVFAVLALATLVGAFKVITTRSIIHAAFWLFPVFAGVAGFYLYLGAQFLAAMQVLIYIGAILVLIVFAVTLTRNATSTDDAQTNGFFFPVVLAAIVFLFSLGSTVLSQIWPMESVGAIDTLPLSSAVQGVVVSDVSALGLVLLSQYLLPFEIASVLLLAAMVGAIVLARKERDTLDTAPVGDAAVAPADARELTNV
jgi:NADH:ubiquinone oxidoreductase subunit 6 (subunit J)